MFREQVSHVLNASYCTRPCLASKFWQVSLPEMSAWADTVNYWQPRGALRMGTRAGELKGL